MRFIRQPFHTFNCSFSFSLSTLSSVRMYHIASTQLTIGEWELLSLPLSCRPLIELPK